MRPTPSGSEAVCAKLVEQAAGLRSVPASCSAAFASSHSASISASVASAGVLPARRERVLDRREAALELQVGRAQRRLGIDVEMAREIDHDEQQIADLARDLLAVAASRAPLRSRRSPRGSWRSPPSGRSSRSRPCRPSAAASSARVSAGRPADTPASAPSRPGAGVLPALARRAAFSSALISSHWPVDLIRASSPCLSPNTCGWRRISFSVIAWTTSRKRERALLLGHAGVEHDLQQQVAEFVPQVVEIAALDRVGDLVGFLDGVGRDGREVLLEVPRAAGLRRAQRRHDGDQSGDVAGGLHPAVVADASAPSTRQAGCPQQSNQRARHDPRARWHDSHKTYYGILHKSHKPLEQREISPCIGRADRC